MQITIINIVKTDGKCIIGYINIKSFFTTQIHKNLELYMKYLRFLH